MAKRGMKLGVTSAVLAGAGAAALAVKKSKENKQEIQKKASEARRDYRNTERGKM